MTDNKTEDKAISPFIWILIISVFLMIVFLSSEPEPTGTTSVESQPQTIANRFPNLQNVEPDAIISNEISEDLLKTMIQIVQLHGNKCDTVSSAFNSRDGSTFNLKCNLFRYSYNFVDKGGEWGFEVEK
jgi:hypothetical protein